RLMYRVLNTSKKWAITGPALVVTIAAMTLTGCGGGGGGHAAITRAPQTNSNLLFYSYPQDGQDNVAPQAPIVLAFGRKIPASASHFHVTDENGDPVAFSLAMVDHGRGVVLTPNQPLSVKSH